MGQVEIKQASADPIADKLDELATLAHYWLKHREKGRMPMAVRSAMLTIVREIKEILDEQKRRNRNRRRRRS